jgi:segregation and condensation protein B
MEKEEIKNIIEVLLFITNTPVSLDKLVETLEVNKENIIEAIDELKKEYQNRPLMINEVAGGYIMSSRPEYHVWIKKLFKEKITYKLSQSALETLAIIAYKQPITRAEIEAIRGVDVSGVIETLLERKLIRVSGRKETLGRPLLYSTTQEFLKYFGLKDLGELPPWDKFVSISSEVNQEAQQNENHNE